MRERSHQLKEFGRTNMEIIINWEWLNKFLHFFGKHRVEGLGGMHSCKKCQHTIAPCWYCDKYFSLTYPKGKKKLNQDRHERGRRTSTN